MYEPRPGRRLKTLMPPAHFAIARFFHAGGIFSMA